MHLHWTGNSILCILTIPDHHTPRLGWLLNGGWVVVGNVRDLSQLRAKPRIFWPTHTLSTQSPLPALPSSWLHMPLTALAQDLALGNLPQASHPNSGKFPACKPQLWGVPKPQQACRPPLLSSCTQPCLYKSASSGSPGSCHSSLVPVSPLCTAHTTCTVGSVLWWAQTMENEASESPDPRIPC